MLLKSALISLIRQCQTTWEWDYTKPRIFFGLWSSIFTCVTEAWDWDGQVFFKLFEHKHDGTWKHRCCVDFFGVLEEQEYLHIRPSSFLKWMILQRAYACLWTGAQSSVKGFKSESVSHMPDKLQIPVPCAYASKLCRCKWPPMLSSVSQKRPLAITLHCINV